MRYICPFCGNELDSAQGYGRSNILCETCQDIVVPKLIEEDKGRKNNETPYCFGYYDNRDISCQRCKRLAKQCKAKFQETRPECFGVKYGVYDECEHCLDSSQCIEFLKKEQRKMARNRKATVRRRSRRRPVEVEPEEEFEDELEEEPEEESENDDDYTKWDIPSLRAECEARGLSNKGRKSLLIKRLMEDDESIEDADDDEEEPEPEPKPVSKRSRRTTKRQRKVTPVKDVVKEDEPDADDGDESADDDTLDKVVMSGLPMGELAAAVFAALESGKVVQVTGMDNGFMLSLAGVATVQSPVQSASKKSGLRGDAYWKEVLTAEYYNFYYEDAGNGKAWQDLGAEEKVDFAEDLEVEWDEHDDARVDAMRMTQAIYNKLDIEKYKPEYKSKAARDALR